MNNFSQGYPFPHAIIDGFWDEQRLERIASEFPAPSDSRWITYPDPKEYGKRAGDSRMWGEHTSAWFAQMRTPESALWLEELTGIGPLTADDIGGGMHMTGENGRLDMHVDFNIHPNDAGLERRLNVLLFLNHDWQKEWGGVLYLGASREVEILPSFNRLIVFETSEHSWHGHPEPVIGDHWRKSLAMYYYAPTRLTAPAPHSTIWKQS